MEKIFVEGMKFELPSEIIKEKAPWIKAKISIKVPELINFLNKHQSSAGWVNIDLKKSKEKGTLYLELNTYKKPETQLKGLDGEDVDINPFKD